MSDTTKEVPDKPVVANGPAVETTAPVEEMSPVLADGVAHTMAGGGSDAAGKSTIGSEVLRGGYGQKSVLSLQRRFGNTAVQRLLGTTESRVAGETAVQRHTSERIEEEENAIQRVASITVQRDLASELQEAVDGWGTDEDAIFAALDRASAEDKRAVLNNPPLIADLRDDLSGTDLGKTMVKLGQPLADQIDYAISGDGTDEDALFFAIESPVTPDAQRRLVTQNAPLMGRMLDDLEGGEGKRALNGLKASLTEKLYAAVRGAGTDEEGIRDAIATAPPEQKQAAVRDRALLEALGDDLSGAEMIQTLRALGASLADQLNIAMDGWGTDEDAIFGMIDGAAEPQKREVLANSGLMSRLRDELTREEMMRLLTSLGASLPDRLNLALDGDVDGAQIVSLIEAADEVQRLRVKENTALVARMRAGVPAESYTRLCELLQLPVPVLTDAGVPDLPGGVPAGGDATEGEEAEPAEPTTLVGKVSAALDAAPPLTGTAVAEIITADTAERASVLEDTALRTRLYAALEHGQLMHVFAALGVNLGSRIDTLITRNVSAADIQAHIATATADEKRSVLDDRVLLERLVAYAGESQRPPLLVALGDTPGNQIDQVLQEAPTVAAIKAIISAATPGQRDELLSNTALIGRLAAAFSRHEHFQLLMALQYGADANYPPQVTALVTAMEGSPTLATVRTPIGQLADADLAKVKTAVREYLRPVLPDDDFVTLLRMLDQGLIVDETINEDWSETLQVGTPTTGTFVPRQFTGNRGFDVGYYRDRVEITVRIQFSAPFWDRQATEDLPALMPFWERMLEGAFDNKFNLRNSQRTLPIRVNMVYNSGSPHHRVNVGSATDVSWPGYNTANWYYRATAYDHAVAPIHEFSHMLGNPDEYNVSAIDFQNTVGTAPTAANSTSQTDSAGNQRFTSLTLMGGGSAVERRHLNYFVNWLNRQRLPGEPAYTLV